MQTSDRFTRAIVAFDAYHQKDPNYEIENGESYPKELLYSRRMTNRLLAFAPDAGEVVQLAARCQHIGRWEIARDKFPMDRKGYLLWRTEEKFHHARIAQSILEGAGYDASIIEEVKTLLLKKELHINPATQLLEDVACLVFIEYYLEDFALKHPDEKVTDILRKTLRKMSDRAKVTMRGIQVSSRIEGLLDQAMTQP